MNLSRLLKLQIKKYRFHKKKRRSKRNMETFAQSVLPKFILLPKKSELPPRGREGGRWQPPAPPARTLMGAITCFFNQTHCSFSQIWYHWDGFVICIIIKCRKILNTPPQDKFESSMQHGSNNINTEIERRTNEHYITDYIELSFSIFLVWSE